MVVKRSYWRKGFWALYNVDFGTVRGVSHYCLERARERGTILMGVITGKGKWINWWMGREGGEGLFLYMKGGQGRIEGLV